MSKETQAEVCDSFEESLFPCSDVGRAADEAQRHPICLLLKRPGRNVRLDRGISRLTSDSQKIQQCSNFNRTK